MQVLVPSLGTSVGPLGPSRAVIPPAFALCQPLGLFLLSGSVPGIPLGVFRGELTIPDMDGTALIAAPPWDRTSWGPWLQGLR